MSRDQFRQQNTLKYVGKMTIIPRENKNTKICIQTNFRTGNSIMMSKIPKVSKFDHSRDVP